MPVPSNHAYVRGGDNICDALGLVLDHAEHVVKDAADSELQRHLDVIRTQARQHPAWGDLGDHVSMWNGGDATVFGVHPSSRRASDAVAAEFGALGSPPAPILRMGAVRGATDIGRRMTERFRRAGF